MEENDSRDAQAFNQSLVVKERDIDYQVKMPKKLIEWNNFAVPEDASFQTSFVGMAQQS